MIIYVDAGMIIELNIKKSAGITKIENILERRSFTLSNKKKKKEKKKIYMWILVFANRLMVMT